MATDGKHVSVRQAMAMIAITAIGFGLTRAYLHDLDTLFRPRPLSLQILGVVPCLAVWSAMLPLNSLVRRNRVANPT